MDFDTKTPPRTLTIFIVTSKTNIFLLTYCFYSLSDTKHCLFCGNTQLQPSTLRRQKNIVTKASVGIGQQDMCQERCSEGSCFLRPVTNVSKLSWCLKSPPVESTPYVNAYFQELSAKIKMYYFGESTHYTNSDIHRKPKYKISLSS